MADKFRTVIIGVVVALFIVANIIAGIYKWGSTGTTPQKQLAQVGETVETGEQPQKVKEQDTEVTASKPPVAETEVQKDSEETVAEAVIEEKSTAQSGEDSQPETGTDQSEQQQQIAAYESEKSELEKEIVRLREELRDKQTLNKKLQAQLGDAKQQNNALKARLDKIRTMVDGE